MTDKPITNRPNRNGEIHAYNDGFKARAANLSKESMGYSMGLPYKSKKKLAAWSKGWDDRDAHMKSLPHPERYEIRN